MEIFLRVGLHSNLGNKKSTELNTPVVPQSSIVKHIVTLYRPFHKM